MVLYECEICSYTTIRKNQYQRHLMTKKHITRCEMSNTNNNNEYSNKENEPHKKFDFKCGCGKEFSREDNFIRHCKHYCNYNKKKFTCQFCNKSYSTNFNLNKHIKKCKKKTVSEENITIKDYKNLFDSMYKELLISNKNLVEEKDKRIEDSEKNKNEILNILKENNIMNTQLFLKQQDTLIKALKENTGGNIYNQTNNNMTNTNYVLQFFNYSEADSMDKIKDKFKMTRDEFLKASLTNGYRGALLEKAENVIIKPYLEAQEKRPIHTVDSSRKKALYKDDNHDKWTFNPKTTLSHCFNEFHKSALEHQDQTIKENPEWVINSCEDNLYKQTYFIPAEIKDKESIFRDVKNHIYKETKVKRELLNDDIALLELTEGIEECNNNSKNGYKNIFDI